MGDQFVASSMHFRRKFNHWAEKKNRSHRGSGGCGGCRRVVGDYRQNLGAHLAK